MAGIFGIVSKNRCVEDLVLGTFYLQHRSQEYCGIGLKENGTLKEYPHKGLVKSVFTDEYLKNLRGNYGLGCVSNYRQPISGLSGQGGAILCFDGKIINSIALRNEMLTKNKMCFSGYSSLDEVNDSALISEIVFSEKNFEKGIEKLIELMKGDFAIVSLAKKGIYAARGWGRKPLVLGVKGKDYAVSSESTSFENTGFEIFRDVKPGEVILLNEDGISNIKQFDLTPVKYGTFEWVYTSYPSSIIDARNVWEVRSNLGKLLAERYPVDADFVSPIPNSGRGYAMGFSKKSGIPYEEVFIRYDYSDRSFTPAKQEFRDKEARTKLIPLRQKVTGKKIILLDDSIVRGTQMLNRVLRLKELGAKEVHVRIGCPPLKKSCGFGYSIKENEECIATRMNLESIRKSLQLDSLGYALVEDLEKAIGFSRKHLCLSCWGL